MWAIFALLSAVFAALVTVLAKLGLKNVDPTLATTLRSFVMFIFLFLFSFATRKASGLSMAQFTKRDWLLIITAGIAGALSWLFYFLGLKIGNATYVAAIDKLSLVFIFILGLLFLGETFCWRSVAGITIMVIGAALICWK
jgi:bacterial/archaeal transporter family protein